MNYYIVLLLTSPSNVLGMSESLSLKSISATLLMYPAFLCINELSVCILCASMCEHTHVFVYIFILYYQQPSRIQQDKLISQFLLLIKS